jgi:hypothetical protein
MELGFDPIDVMLLILNDVLQEFPARIVRQLETGLNA